MVDKEQLSLDLGERLKYFLMDQLRDVFNIKELTINDLILNKVDEIVQYDVYIVADCLDASDGASSKDWGKLIKNIDKKLHTFLNEFTIDPIKHKIIRNNQYFVTVDEGFFFKLNFEYDESHLFEVSYLVSYE